MIDADTPFVLLDDARRAHAAPARLYRDPVDTVTATTPAQVPRLLEALRVARRGGLHAAGFLAYEAGHALAPHLAAPPAPDVPLAWFGLFQDYREIAAADVAALLPDPRGGWIGAPRPAIDRAAHLEGFARVQALIAAGDIYQANLTLRAELAVLGDPLALHAGLRLRARAGYGAIVWTGADWLLSHSPELMVALKDGTATARPMKGTAPPDADPAALASDPKQRAENLMIVDLLRNDLSRVAQAGSVAVPRLFHVERYPTVQQMTSTVTATLTEGRDAIDLVAALFPCGSITGAPKLRAMEVIGEVEDAPRGAYCGAIGRLDADGDAALNVAIRTLHLKPGAATATLGIGSGIVADSDGFDEWEECLAKARFAPSRTPDLIETMRFDPEHGILRIDLHMARMKASAAALGIAFDRHAARNELQAATFRQRTPAKVRLLLSPSGRIAVALAPLPAETAAPPPLDVALAPLPVAPDDWRLAHKTSDRRFYDAARARAGTFEVALIRRDGFVTEGSFTNLFVERDGRLLTPPARLGLLPGVLRRALIDEGCAVEAELTAGDLAGGFLIGNALRGLMPARLVEAPALMPRGEGDRRGADQSGDRP